MFLAPISAGTLVLRGGFYREAIQPLHTHTQGKQMPNGKIYINFSYNFLSAIPMDYLTFKTDSFPIIPAPITYTATKMSFMYS
jgi:hypothetical protein